MEDPIEDAREIISHELTEINKKKGNLSIRSDLDPKTISEMITLYQGWEGSLRTQLHFLEKISEHVEELEEQFDDEEEE